MTTTVEVIAGGITYPLTDITQNAALRIGENGAGLSPLHRLSHRGAQQHGITDDGYYLDPRLIQLVLVLKGDDPADYYNRRADLIEIFAPREEPITLKYTLPTGAIRQIDCHYSGGLHFPLSNQIGNSQRAIAVELIAPDPAFYDPEVRSESFEVAVGAYAFEVPMSVDLHVGTSTINASKLIVYEGTWRDHPIITVQGPVTDLIIENQTTDERLDFTGSTIGATEQWTINLREKTIVDQNGNSRIATLTSGSDFGTWHLASKIDVPRGENTIKVTGSGGQPTTQVYIRYNFRYLGI